MIRSIIIVCLLCLGLSGCGGSQSKEKTALDLQVYFTADAKGRIEPCGCFTGQHGGLSRAHTYINKHKKGETLMVDAGDAIASREDYDIILHRYMLKAYQEIGFDALNAGHREAALDLKQLKAIKAMSPIPLISANLIEKDTGKTVWDAYKIVKKGDYRVAIIGLLDDRHTGALGNGLSLEKMNVSLANTLKKVKDQADVIVVLAFCDEEGMRNLAKEFYEVDLIIGGQVQQPASELIHENNSMIAYTTNEARALGMIHLKIEGQNKVKSTFYDMVLLHDRIPESHQVQQFSKDYRKEIRNAILNIDKEHAHSANFVPGVKPSAEYVGSKTCATCHPKSHKVWKGTYHANAFAALKKMDADADPRCIDCHTVGFGQPGGYKRKFKETKRINVGCESCHGPGSIHVKERMSGEKPLFHFRPLGEGDCRKCHYGEFSRPFNWDAMWPKIKHGKEVVQQ